MSLNFNLFYMVSTQDYSAVFAVRRVMKILKEIWKGDKEGFVKFEWYKVFDKKNRYVFQTRIT